MNNRDLVSTIVSPREDFGDPTPIDCKNGPTM